MLIFQKKKHIEQIRKDHKSETELLEFHSARFKRGGFSALLSFIIFAVVIAINLVVGALPSTYTKYDISSAQYYTISEQTKEIVGELEDEVVIYLLAEAGTEDQRIVELLNRYDILSDNISVEVIDTVLFPNFSQQFTEVPLYTNTVIVVGPKWNKIVEYGDIYVLDYALYYANGTYEYDFDGEGQITAAIEYVTNEDFPKVYSLTGHGEAELTYNLKSALKEQNIEVVPLSLVANITIPDDTDCLMIVAPKSDLNDIEEETVLSYLEDGGKLLLITAYAIESLPNIDSLMENYGIKLVDGIVFEGNTSYSIKDHNNYLLPDIQFHDITQPLINNNYRVVLPNTQAGKELDSYRSTLEIIPLLSTSEVAYSKISGYALTTRDKEVGDIDGPFTLGFLISEKFNNLQTDLIWFGSSFFLDAKTDATVSGANSDLFLNSLAYLCNYESGISIHSKSMRDGRIVLSSAQSVLWSILLIIIIPLAILVTGSIIWLRRRKK